MPSFLSYAAIVALSSQAFTCFATQADQAVTQRVNKAGSTLASQSAATISDESFSKLNILVIHSASCPHCNRLMEDVFTSFTDDSVKHGISPSSKVQYLDTKKRSDLEVYMKMVKQNELAQDVDAIPTVVFLDGAGKEVSTNCRILGYSNSQDFYNQLKQKAKVCSR